MATVAEIIAYADGVRPNAFSNEIKVKWLNEVEGKVQTDVLKLAPEACEKRYWTYEKSAAGATFTANTITLPSKSAFYAGEFVTVSGCTVNTGNNKTVKVASVSADGLVLTFSDGTFTAGAETASILISSDRSWEETVVKFPHDKLYGDYVAARICEGVGETDSANNHMTRFNEFYDEFSKWFIRNYNPSRAVI